MKLHPPIRQIQVGDEGVCDAFSLKDDKVLVFIDDVWIELRPPSVERMRDALRKAAVFLHAPLVHNNAADTARLQVLDAVRSALAD